MLLSFVFCSIGDAEQLAVNKFHEKGVLLFDDENMVTLQQDGDSFFTFFQELIPPQVAELRAFHRENLIFQVVTLIVLMGLWLLSITKYSLLREKCIKRNWEFLKKILNT